MIRSIDSHMWDHAKFRTLSQDGRYLWIYLLTCQHSHCGGLYSLQIRLALSDLSTDGGRQWTRARLLAAFEELGDLAQYDAERQVVFVPKMLDRQGRAPQHRKAMAHQCRALKKSPLARRALDCYPEVAEYLDPDFVASLPIETAAAEPQPRPVRTHAPRESETDWRVDRTWEAFLAARAEFYQRVDGRKPSRAPSLTAEIRASIVDALRQHDAGMLTAETRDLWVEESITLAAGEGLWLDPWCTGQDARSTTRYVEPWRPWKQQRGKGDPVAKFAELAFARRSTTPKRAPSREGILLGRLIAAETSGFDVADLRARYEHVWDTPGLIDQLEAALAERTKEIA